ncbi:MAG: dTMP kinase [Thermoplasmata archaeon]|nr:dTMP kinase [Thermoplasmata archaeon]
MVSGFITFEGIDGCGKSTVARLIGERLEAQGINVELTLEPTRTWLGDAVRRSYTEDIHPYTEAFLFLADRATHTNWINEKLSSGNVVISDRYSDSTVAYQAAQFHQKLGGPMPDYVKWLQEVSQPIIRTPDLTLLLDIDPEVSLARLGGREEMEKFETLDNLKLVRENYLAIAEDSPHFRIIDATKTVEEVTEEVWGIINQEL